MTQADKLLKIINHYGVNHQQRKLNEEVFELQETIIKAENPYEPIQDIEHITEEIADCYVMLEQFRLYYDIDLEQIKEVGKYKIDRQLKRMKEESNGLNK